MFNIFMGIRSSLADDNLISIDAAPITTLSAAEHRFAVNKITLLLMSLDRLIYQNSLFSLNRIIYQTCTV